MGRRILEEVPLSERPYILTSAYLLLGLHFDAATVADFLKGLHGMHESSTYQAILEEGAERGAAREARRMLMLFGERALGPSDAGARAAIEAIDDPERLEALALRLDSARDWHDLLAPPRTTPRTSRPRKNR